MTLSTSHLPHYSEDGLEDRRHGRTYPLTKPLSQIVLTFFGSEKEIELQSFYEEEPLLHIRRLRVLDR